MGGGRVLLEEVPAVVGLPSGLQVHPGLDCGLQDVQVHRGVDLFTGPEEMDQDIAGGADLGVLFLVPD